MTIAARETIQLKGLAREKLDALKRKAKHMGMSPASYVKWLVEKDVAISEEARTRTFAEIMGPGRVMDEDELDALVEKAKAEHHARVSKKKR